MSTSHQPRVSLSVEPGPGSATNVRDWLSELTDADPVVLEQIAVLVGALTSEHEEVAGRPPSPIEVSLWTDASAVRVELRDRSFALHRSEAGLVQLDRSMVSGWRLKLVERLADRWTVAHDEELILSFEFDNERSERPPSAAGELAASPAGARWGARLHRPNGGPGSISTNGGPQTGRPGSREGRPSADD